MKKIGLLLASIATFSLLASCSNNKKEQNLGLSMLVFVDDNETISFESNDSDKFTVNWGDGVVNNEKSHTYKTCYNYSINIVGELNSFKYTSDNRRSIQNIDATNVVSFAPFAFKDCSELWAARFNDKLTQIGESSFQNCTRLAHISSIPKNITVINKNSFNGCSKLDEVTFEEGSKLTSIDDSVFKNTIIASITIPSGVTRIGNSAFSNTKLTSITIPSSVTTIGDNAFDNSEIKTVTFEEGSKLTSIGNSAFRNTKLASVTIPNGVTKLSGFNGTNLTSITIPSSVTIIGDDAFGSSKIKTVTFEEGSKLTSIGNSAFAMCELISIDIPEGTTSIGSYAFQSCHSLNSISVPESIESIGEDAFVFCTALSYNVKNKINYIGNKTNGYMVAVFTTDGGVSTDYTISDGCKIICSGLFYGSSLKSISIPSSVTSIGTSAFHASSYLEEVDLKALSTPPSLGASAFTKCHNDIKFYIAKGTKSLYLSAENWKDIPEEKFIETEE